MRPRDDEPSQPIMVTLEVADPHATLTIEEAPTDHSRDRTHDIPTADLLD